MAGITISSYRLFTINYIVLDNGCWEWQLYKDNFGYGRTVFYGDPYLAHRASYRLFVGEIPDGLLICHKCDNPNCVNPFHLFCGTYKDNSDDMIKKGRNPTLNFKHPSINAYTHHGCRCDGCKALKKEINKIFYSNKMSRKIHQL